MNEVSGPLTETALIFRGAFGRVGRMNLAVIFALVTFVCWGVGDVLGAIATRRVNATTAAFWLAIVSVPMMLLIAPSQLDSLSNWTLPLLLLTVVIGTGTYVGVLLFYRAIEEDSASIVGVIAGAYPILVVALSILFLGERLSGFQGIAIGVTIVGVILTGLKRLPWHERTPKSNKGVLLALGAMVLWGIYITFLKLPAQAVGWFWPGAVVSIAGIVMLTIVMFVRGYAFVPKKLGSAWWALILNGVLINVGGFSIAAALRHGSASIVGPISGAYPVLFVIGAYLVFREKLLRHQIAGTVLALAGVIALSAMS